MDKHLHIVTHEIPWPVRHGGYTDLYFKIVELHKKGIKIHLHCFRKDPNREEKELLKYCVSIHYYNRRTGFKGISLSLPYIVQSRKSDELEINLCKDRYPVLLEGVHCTALLYKGALIDRNVVVRLHNVEYKYYNQLARSEKNILKKIYYFNESRLLKKYEKYISQKCIFLSVSSKDAEVYQDEFKASITFVPVFHPYSEVSSLPGKGSFCLYHGNLSVSENEKAAEWLLREVFDGMSIPFVIAGKDPSASLTHLVESKANTCLVANPSQEEMHDLINKAQINIIPSFNDTGVKLKLLNALFNGRHSLLNLSAVNGSGLDKLCNLADRATQFKEKISKLYNESLTNQQTDERKIILSEIYDNEKNARLLISLIW
ncbi:MAG: glycosyltransferase family 4 protein [Ferruginibacter sp.]